MKIRNFKDLATTQRRTDGLSILSAGLDAIDTHAVISKTVSLADEVLSIAGATYDLKQFSRIRVAGVGKCSGDAAGALSEVLGGRLTDGIIIDTHERSLPKNIQLRVGSHPLPEERNVQATLQLISFLDECTDNDLLIFIVSGGGSTLLCQPEGAMTCADEANIVSSLMREGATIQETNTVRKHLSKARGGGVAKHAYPATVAALTFSDVPGDDIAFIASGPTVQDTSTVEDARHVLSAYGLASAEKFLIETPKEEKLFERVMNTVVVSNAIALDAMRAHAQELGYAATIVTATLSGEAQDVSRDILMQLHDAPEKTALLFGGETTVASGEATGIGGRNQEVVLAGLSDVKEGELLVACASDGRDNTDAAGAVCDTALAQHAKEIGIAPEEHLTKHDAYAFFEAVGGHISTGDTGSNVSDLIIALK
ncbi:MAG: hydroxypyruvate reductase [Candidatus Campbellbacteria bacterium]